MTLDQLRTFLNTILNKEQRGRVLTPTKYNTLLRTNNLKHFKKKVGLPEEYRPGQPIPRQIYEITSKISGDLRPFITTMDDSNIMLSVNSSGQATIPTDMYYPSSLGYNYVSNAANCSITESMRLVEVLTDAEWNPRLGSTINPPSLLYPIAIFRSSYIEFRPKNIQFVNFIYLKYPLTPYYDYYKDSDDVEIYLSPGTTHALAAGETGSGGQTTGTVTSQSVELEWDRINIIDIAHLILADMGINIREQQLQQYAEMRKGEGV